jgi:broad specificity phosphatase PhoE
VVNPPSDPRGVVAAMDSGTGTDLLAPGVRLVLVRHGVTDYTVAGRLDGRGGADPPLNAHGLAQAQAVAAVVPALVGEGHEHVEVVTSSLQRVRMTGAAIAQLLGRPATVDAGWDERSFGDWDGRTLAEIHAAAPEELARMRRDPAHPPPGGESRAGGSYRRGRDQPDAPAHRARARVGHRAGALLGAGHRAGLGERRGPLAGWQRLGAGGEPSRPPPLIVTPTIFGGARCRSWCRQVDNVRSMSSRRAATGGPAAVAR